MSTDQSTSSAAPPARPTDRQDERITESAGLRDSFHRFVDRLRSGDLGLVPVVLGLVVISAVLQVLNPVFLSSTNLVNLLLECAPVGVIALGIVVRPARRPDRPLGRFGERAVQRDPGGALRLQEPAGPGRPRGRDRPRHRDRARSTGPVFTRFGIPSFVITLAGLLGFLGLQLYVLRGIGSINLPFDSGLVTFAQLAFVPAWLSYVLAVVDRRCAARRPAWAGPASAPRPA